MQSRAIFLWSFILLLLAGCDAAVEPSLLSNANPSKVRGKIWKWEAYTTINGGYRTDVPASSHFAITGDSVDGVSGCNAFMGSCTLDGSHLRMSQVISTLKGCNDKRSFVCELEESTVQYFSRDSLLVLVPQSGEMVHLIFRQQ